MNPPILQGSSQAIAIKAAIIADSTMNAIPEGDDGAYAIAGILNAIASPDFLVWRSDVPIQDIFNAITWANFTPADSPEATGIYTARAMAIQIKQRNLQIMMLANPVLDCTRVNIRAGLRDAVISLPSGASGAAVAAGGASGATVLTACLRQARLCEKILTSGSAQTGNTTGNLMGNEGSITKDEVLLARAS